MNKIILTEKSEKENRRHALVIRIVGYGDAWHNLGSLCLGGDKASGLCIDCVHLDLRYDSGKGERYLIGEIQAQGGNFRCDPALEKDGAVQVGSGPKTQQPPSWPELGNKSQPKGKTPRGASACWGGVVYESWRSYRVPEHAVAYLKRYFDVLADGFNEIYTQEWIDQACGPSPREQYSHGQTCADSVRTRSAKRAWDSQDALGIPLISASILPGVFSNDDILKSIVQWIQEEPFQRCRRHSGKISAILDAPKVQGWDSRVKEYAYAKRSGPNFVEVYRDVLPLIKDLASLIGMYDSWFGAMSAPEMPTVVSVARVAENICLWGGVVQDDYSEAWKVLRDAISEKDNGAKMNSGWTKVASFATDGMRGREQTIWDSRVATSIIWRIDQILFGAVSNGRITKADAQKIIDGFKIGVVASRNVGTRPRRLEFYWPNGYGNWDCHFNGGAVVRQMVKILNDPQNNFPRMPYPTFDEEMNDTGEAYGNWTVFGAGLVLFMDGW